MTRACAFAIAGLGLFYLFAWCSYGQDWGTVQFQTPDRPPADAHDLFFGVVMIAAVLGVVIAVNVVFEDHLDRLFAPIRRWWGD